MRLSPEQSRALDLTRPMGLSAGAGSGKTGVLIERYLRAVADVGFDLDRVLAVSFTKKASAEVLGRIREGVSERIRTDAANAAQWRRVRERLPDAWVMTIDAFCHRLLSSLGPAAGLPPRRRILAGGALAEFMNEAVRQVVDGAAAAPDAPDRESLRMLLHAFGRRGLVEHLRVLIEHRGRALPWARAVLAEDPPRPERLLAILANVEGTAPKSPGPFDAEQLRIQCALAGMFERMLARHRDLLAAAHACDFRQLLEDVARAFDDDRVRRRWASRFRHVLVDEFQDTDPLQWEVLRKLFGNARIERPGLFVVGDEKQAIFSFREGDVATFREAAAEIAGARGSEETLADNYRSTPALVSFFNGLSETLFAGASLPFEARHAPMRPARAAEHLVDSKIEVMLARGGDSRDSREGELGAVAARILRFVEEKTDVYGDSDDGKKLVRPARFSDQAILLRTRNILADLESVLMRWGIPFKVLGGIGLFSCHEVRALVNLMRFLANDRDDLALLGVLRSPLFSIADSVLLAAATRDRRAASLWRKVRDLASAVGSGHAETPTPSDAPVLLDAVDRLGRYRGLADRLAANDLLALAVRESDLILTLDVVDPSGRAGANVEKVLDMVRNLHRDGVCTLDDIVETLSFTDHESDSPEAQADPPVLGRDAVSILTVHAAKGLEWPIVFVPQIAANAKRNKDDVPVPLKVRAGRDVAVMHAVRSRDIPGGAKQCRLQASLGSLAQRAAIAEAKRLFYVAVTRARDHLVLSAALTAKTPASESWLAWLRAAGDVGVRWLDPVPPAVAPPVTGPAAIPTLERPAQPAAPRPIGRPALSVPATALAVLLRCQRRFFLEHVVGLPPAWGPPHAAAPEVEPSGGPETPERISATARGAIVHAALEGIAMGVDPASRVRGVARQAGVGDEDVVSALEAEVQRATGFLRAWPLGAEILDAPAGTVFTEVPVEIGEGSILLAGAIDLLYRPSGRRAVILDFKTDRDAPRGATAGRAWALDRGYADQLAVYAASVEARFGGGVSAWLFLTDSGTAVPIVGEPGTPSAAACAGGMGRLLDIVAAALRDGFPLTSDPGACRACPHRSSRVCPGVSDGAKKVDAVDSSSIPPWYGFPCEVSAASLTGR